MHLGNKRNIRKIISEGICKGIWRRTSVVNTRTGLRFLNNAVNPVPISVKAVKAQLVGGHQKNDNTGSNADPKSDNIDQRVVLVPDKVPKRKEDIVFNHTVFLKSVFFFNDSIGFTKAAQSDRYATAANTNAILKYVFSIIILLLMCLPDFEGLRAGSGFQW
jgi:hypothetical protein